MRHHHPAARTFVIVVDQRSRWAAPPSATPSTVDHGVAGRAIPSPSTTMSIRSWKNAPVRNMASIPSHQGIEAMLSTAQPVIMDHHAGFRSK